MKDSKKPKKEKKPSLIKKLFAKFFGFEENIDLTNETLVLKRRNEVIKNIIFIINILLFIMMFIYSTFTTTSNLFVGKTHKILNWVITAATFPMTFVINFFLKRLIRKGRDDDTQSQRIAMYFGLTYLVILVIIFYVKINLQDNYTENLEPEYHRFAEVFSYLIFYLVVVVAALYQDRNVLFNMVLFIFAVITIMHFFVTHNMVSVISAGKKEELAAAIIDIVLRSFVFVTFSVIVYTTTNISVKLQSERKKELLKRKEAEGDFQTIAKIIFDLIKGSPEHLFSSKDTENVFVIAKHLSSLLGLSKDEQDRLYLYNKIHLRYLELQTTLDEEEPGFDDLKEKTLLASEIIKRIQLGQKVENIIRSYTERRITRTFIKNQQEQELDDIGKVILISEVYYRLRSPQDYKVPYRHVDAIDIMKKDLSYFLNESFLMTFIQFQKDFEKIYLELS